LYIKLFSRIKYNFYLEISLREVNPTNSKREQGNSVLKHLADERNIRIIALHQLQMKSKINLLLFLLIGISTLNSCQKETTCYASIFVIDETGRPMGGAKVLVFSDRVSPVKGPSLINKEKTTDKNGRVDFELNLLNILFCTANLQGYSKIPVGPESIKFEEGKRTFVTIQMKQ
jgi:hypothetical protein